LISNNKKTNQPPKNEVDDIVGMERVRPFTCQPKQYQSFSWHVSFFGQNNAIVEVISELRLPNEY
jgi:hypothetical protein